VWSIEGGSLRDFRGPFVEWEADVERRARAASAAAAGEAARARTSGKPASRAAPPGEAARRNAKRAVESAERAVSAAEERVQELEAALADPALYDGTGEGARRAGDITRELQAARATHDGALAAWAEAVEQLEQVRG
jgi:ATP-binding cassette subfamily F protein 3